MADDASLAAQFTELVRNPLYAAFISGGAAALLAGLVAAIWRRSFMWLIGMIFLVVVVTIPLQLFTTQLAPLASQFARMDGIERFLWINALPCGLIFLLGLYVIHLASKERQWARIEAEAIAARDRKELSPPPKD